MRYDREGDTFPAPGPRAPLSDYAYYQSGHLPIMTDLTQSLRDLRKLVDEQAEDDGLWFGSHHASEAYLQQELRKLHAAIEAIGIPAA